MSEFVDVHLTFLPAALGIFLVMDQAHFEVAGRCWGTSRLGSGEHLVLAYKMFVS